MGSKVDATTQTLAEDFGGCAINFGITNLVIENLKTSCEELSNKLKLSTSEIVKLTIEQNNLKKLLDANKAASQTQDYFESKIQPKITQEIEIDDFAEDSLGLDIEHALKEKKVKVKKFSDDTNGIEHKAE